MADQSSAQNDLIATQLSGAGRDILMPRLLALAADHDLSDTAVGALKDLLVAALKEGCRVGLVEAQACLLEAAQPGDPLNTATHTQEDEMPPTDDQTPDRSPTIGNLETAYDGQATTDLESDFSTVDNLVPPQTKQGASNR
jgi:hypothetical protein